MDRSSRAPWTLFRSGHLAAMLFLLIAGEAIGIGLSFGTRASHPELSTIFAGGAATLFFGALLGGVVSLLIADFDRRRLQRAAQLDFISNVLSDLKDVYDGVDSGRTLMRAHRSAKTYGEQMRKFIEARVKLLNVVRALKFDERGEPIGTVGAKVSSMQQYLRILISEFETNYKDISRLQSLHEARMEHALKKVAAAPNTDPELPANEPWAVIAALPSVADFITPLGESDASNYKRDFLCPLDSASDQLRKALHAELA